MDLPSTLPSTRKMQMSVVEIVARIREQGIMPERPVPTTREENYVLPGVSVDGFRELQRVFVPKPSDVFVASYPKSGTTWVQHIVSLIKNNGVDDGMDIDDKWLWYEQFSAAEIERYSAHFEGTRTFKSHLPYTLMPGLTADSPAKYIFVYRNPKDTAVSYYYHLQPIFGQTTWDSYFDKFVNGELPLGSVLDSHMEWWAHKDDLNVLLICYEEMKADLNKCIKTIASFLGHDLSVEEIVKISEQCTFTAMKKNNAVNKTSSKVFGDQFIRKGIVGDWKNYFTADQSARMDKLVEEKITGIGLEYDYGQ